MDRHSGSPMKILQQGLFNGNFSLSVTGFVQEVLSTIFRKSDFVTNFAATGRINILTLSIVVRLGADIKKL